MGSPRAPEVQRQEGTEGGAGPHVDSVGGDVSPRPSARNSPQAAGHVLGRLVSAPVPPRSPLREPSGSWAARFEGLARSTCRRRRQDSLRRSWPVAEGLGASRRPRDASHQRCACWGPLPAPLSAAVGEGSVLRLPPKWGEGPGTVSLEAQPGSGGAWENSGSLQFSGRNKTEKTANQ